MKVRESRRMTAGGRHGSSPKSLRDGDPSGQCQVEDASRFRRTDKSSVRVLIADNHPLTRAGIVALINQKPDFKVIGEASSGRSAIELYKRLQPDTLVLDVWMPDSDGLVTIAQIIAYDPTARIVVLTENAHDVLIAHCCDAGARGFLLKDKPREELLGAIHAISRGRTFFGDGARQKLGAQLGVSRLSIREVEVLRELSRGETNHGIAGHLGVSAETVKFHLKRIFAKLAVNTRTEAISAGRRIGIIYSILFSL